MQNDIGILSYPRNQKGVLYSTVPYEYRNSVYWFRRKTVLKHATATLRDIISSERSILIGWQTYFINVVAFVSSDHGYSLVLEDPYGTVQTEPYDTTQKEVESIVNRMVVIKMLYDDGKLYIDSLKKTFMRLDGTIAND